MKRTLIFENRRNHLQVLYDILELCEMPQAKTRILRNTNTSFKLLESYLLQLQTSDFLELQPKIKKYVTTEEGQKFIDAWIMLKTMLYPQEVPVLSRNKKCTIHNNHFIAVPANNTNYVTIEKEKTPTSFP